MIHDTEISSTPNEDPRRIFSGHLADLASDEEIDLLPEVDLKYLVILS